MDHPSECFIHALHSEEGKPQARVHDLETVNAILDVFQEHGHKEVDTARVYWCVAQLVCGAPLQCLY